MTVNVMVDLETMSTRSNAAICSIGAVKFEGKEILDKFYCTYYTSGYQHIENTSVLCILQED
jgi:DNA polymerase III epsilon subunit-like protein